MAMHIVGNASKPVSVTSKKGILKKSPSISVSNANSVKKSKSSMLHNSTAKTANRKTDSRLSHEGSLQNIDATAGNRSTNAGTSTSMTLTSLGKGITKSLADAMGQIGAGLQQQRPEVAAENFIHTAHRTGDERRPQTAIEGSTKSYDSYSQNSYMRKFENSFPPAGESQQSH